MKKIFFIIVIFIVFSVIVFFYIYGKENSNNKIYSPLDTSHIDNVEIIEKEYNKIENKINELNVFLNEEKMRIKNDK